MKTPPTSNGDCPGQSPDSAGHGVSLGLSACPPPQRGDTGQDTRTAKITKTFNGTQEAACLKPDCQAGPWTARNALAVAARHTKVFGHPTLVHLDTKVTITREAGAA